MKEDNWQEVNLPEGVEPPKEFDLVDAEICSEENDFLYAGQVKAWQQRELSEKAKIRPYITSAVILLWFISTTVSALSGLTTGNFLLIVPPILIIGPLYIVLKFYYRSA